ncbi:hypothetical protein NXC24_PB00346 (plasmid) [Rhizobium sp. NXC24]|nr:hypothetical protein NXC24_PB00346 [Rhizobium sp. NXC24]
MKFSNQQIDRSCAVVQQADRLRYFDFCTWMQRTEPNNSHCEIWTECRIELDRTAASLLWGQGARVLRFHVSAASPFRMIEIVAMLAFKHHRIALSFRFQAPSSLRPKPTYPSRPGFQLPHFIPVSAFMICPLAEAGIARDSLSGTESQRSGAMEARFDYELAGYGEHFADVNPSRSQYSKCR